MTAKNISDVMLRYLAPPSPHRERDKLFNKEEII